MKELKGIHNIKSLSPEPPGMKLGGKPKRGAKKHKAMEQGGRGKRGRGY